MSNRIPTPTMGEILTEEFMIPMNLTAYKLAHSIHVPTSRIQDILHNRRKITADTSIRLGRFFGVSDRFFLDMQNNIEVRELIVKLDGDITTIKPYAAVAMCFKRGNILATENLIAHASWTISEIRTPRNTRHIRCFG